MLKVLRFPEAVKTVGKSRAWIYGEIAAGRFPKPIRIGNSTGFLSTEIEAYLKSLVAARDAGTAPDGVSPNLKPRQKPKAA